MLNLDRVLTEAGPFGTEALSRDELTEAKALVARYRAAEGFKAVYAPLVSAPGDNVKLSKSEVPAYSLSLAPARSSGYANTCNRSTPVCERYCVAFTGNGGFAAVLRGRTWKVKMLAEHPETFVRLLAHEIRNAVKAKGQITMRLNTFSDLRWERFAPELFNIAGVSFYDYTKWAPVQRQGRNNYHLTFSATERTTDNAITSMVDAGHNVAVVVSLSRFMAKPQTWKGMPVVDGDKSDDRTLDPAGSVVLLTAKGKLRTNTDPGTLAFRHAE